MDGVFSHLFRTMILEDQKTARWLIMDGPVDTLWIESMNSLLDDSKTLTMNNGDRLSLTPNCKLLFEVADLDKASPATISRVGLVYMDAAELGYTPHLNCWIRSKEKAKIGIRGEDFKDLIQNLSTTYIYSVMKCKATVCKEMIKTSELACIINFTKLFDSVMGQYKKGEEEETEGFKGFISRIFVFALIWSVGATVREESRRELDLVIRNIDPIFPHSATVFEYYVHPEKKDFFNWDDYLQRYMPPQGTAFHDIYVPT
jgi:dynein heavy chain